MSHPASPAASPTTWAQAISPNGAKTSLGLGSYPVVTLAMAREKALPNARAIAEGRDPRRRMQKVPTFEKANETVVVRADTAPEASALVVTGEQRIFCRELQRADSILGGIMPISA